MKEKLILPTGSESLLELASKSKNACIVVSDKTRPVPNKIILPVILDTLESAGVKRENIIFLIASGIHSPTNSDADYQLQSFWEGKLLLLLKVTGEVAREVKNGSKLGSDWCRRASRRTIPEGITKAKNAKLVVVMDVNESKIKEIGSKYHMRYCTKGDD